MSLQFSHLSKLRGLSVRVSLIREEGRPLPAARSPIIFGSELDSGAFAVDLVLSTLQNEGAGPADGASSCAGPSGPGGAEGVDSCSESRASLVAGGDRNCSSKREQSQNRRELQSRGGRTARRATTSLDSGDSIVTADTTPPPSMALNAAPHYSQASSVPATDRLHLGHGSGRGRDSTVTKRFPGKQSDEEDDDSSNEGYGGSQASVLSVPATDRRASVSPRELPPAARCPPPSSRQRLENAPARSASAVSESSASGGRLPASVGASPVSEFVTPEARPRNCGKRSRSPQAGEEGRLQMVPDTTSPSAYPDSNGTASVIGGAAASAPAPSERADAAAASDAEEEDEYVDATPSPPPR